MSPRRLVPFAVLALGLSLCSVARADTSTINGVFTADNDVYSDSFSVASAATYTFATTSAAAGGFLPVLTLFNIATGAPVGYTDSGFGDVSLSGALDEGSYVLELTEFPNEANGFLADGFRFSPDPTATGDTCGGSLAGQSFINSETCLAGSLKPDFTLDTTITPAMSSSVTPEPSTFLLVLAPAAGLINIVRRRRQAA